MKIMQAIRAIHPNACHASAVASTRDGIGFGTRRPGSVQHLPSTAAAGFTFIEILFAVIILGVGMIMIAGMLPVAIKQNAETRADLSAANVAQSGYAYLRTLIQTHPEAFPETCGERNFTEVNGQQPIDFLTAGTPFEKLLGYQLMGLSSSTFTRQNAAGANVTFRNNYVANAPVDLSRSYAKAGRVIPLSNDVIHPRDASGNPWANFRLAQLLENEALDVSPKISEYPLAWHQSMMTDRISSGDARYQWFAFYRRDEGSKLVKLTIVAMRLQNTDAVSNFDTSTLVREGIQAADATGGGAFDRQRNGPFLVPVEIEDGVAEPDRVKFVQTGADPLDAEVAQSGAYLIIAHSPPLNGNPDNATAPGDLSRPYRNNGRVFKLATRREDLDSAAGGARVWDLAPGFDLSIASPGEDGIPGTADDWPDGSMNRTVQFSENTGANQVRPTTTAGYVNQVSVRNGTAAPRLVQGTTAWAWIIGRGRLNPASDTTDSFNGPTQDLHVLSVDVPIP